MSGEWHAESEGEATGVAKSGVAARGLEHQDQGGDRLR